MFSCCLIAAVCIVLLLCASCVCVCVCFCQRVYTLACSALLLRGACLDADPTACVFSSWLLMRGQVPYCVYVTVSGGPWHGPWQFPAVLGTVLGSFRRFVCCVILGCVCRCTCSSLQSICSMCLVCACVCQCVYTIHAAHSCVHLVCVYLPM